MLPTIEISPAGAGAVTQQQAFTWNGAGDNNWHSFSSASESYLLFLNSSTTYHIEAYRLTAQAAAGYTFQRFEITYDTDESGSLVPGGNTYVSGYLDTVGAEKQSSSGTFRRLIGNFSETSGSYSYSYHVTGIKAVFDQGTPPATSYTISAYSSPQNAGNVQVGNAESGATSSQAVEAGGSVNIVATPASGYAFKGWYLGNTLVSSSATYTVSNVRAAQTFEARYIPIYHVQVVTYKSAGRVSLNGTQGDDTASAWTVAEGDFVEGSSITIAATSLNATLRPFKAWYLNPYAWGNPEISGTLIPGAGSTYTTTVTASATYFATFQYPVYIAVSAAGDYGTPDVSLTINGSAVSSLEVPSGSSVTISAPIDGGVPTQGEFDDAHYYFSHWANQSGDVLSTNERYTFQSGEWGSEHNYVAHYKTYLKLNTDIDPDSSAGSISVSPASSHGDYYELGTSITLTATANTGWTFRKWVSSSGEESQESAMSLDVSDIDGVTWTAYFAEPGYSVITTNVSPQSEASRTTLTGAGTYPNGSQCTIEATPVYPGVTKFGVWQSASGETSRDNPLSFEVTQDDTWTAYMIGAPSSYFILLTYVEPKDMGYVDGGTVHVIQNGYPIFYAHANSGYRFVKWVSSGGTMSTRTGLSYQEYYNQHTWTAYFEYDGTDLLVNSSDLGSPVKLVYDDRSGGTGLLIADY